MYVACNSFLHKQKLSFATACQHTVGEVIEVVDVNWLDCGCSCEECTQCSMIFEPYIIFKAKTVQVPGKKWGQDSNCICVYNWQCWAHQWILIRHIQSCAWNPLNPKFVRVRAFLVIFVYVECNSFLFFAWTEIMVCHGISTNCLEVIEVLSVSQWDCGCSFNKKNYCGVQGQNCPSAKKETRQSSHHICVINRQCWAHHYICLD